MELLAAIFSHPFVWGLLLGLVFAAWAFFSGWGAKRALRKEVRRLEESVRTQNEVAAAGRQALLDENASLKKSNENLRITLATFQSKPDKAELRQLHLFDKAVHLLLERAPGFAPAWEGALKEAQADLEKSLIGRIPFIRRFIHPSLPTAAVPPSAALPPPDGKAADADPTPPPA